MSAEPFDNQPVRHPNGVARPLHCEVRVYSSDRSDFGGRQCGNIARWRIADFDKWGDILVCRRHIGRGHRSTETHSIFGMVKGEPTSWRFLREKRAQTAEPVR